MTIARVRHGLRLSNRSDEICSETRPIRKITTLSTIDTHRGHLRVALALQRFDRLKRQNLEPLGCALQNC